jgi:hypothetical protein
MSTKLAVYARLLQTARLIAGVLALAAVAATGRAAVLAAPAGRGGRGGASPARPLLHEPANGRFDANRPHAGGRARGRAAVAAKKLRDQQIPSGASTFGGAWTQIGPNPVVQGLRSPGRSGLAR